MKTKKRLFALVLALALLLSLSVTAFATMEGELGGGSITITNAAVGETYKAYQILYLESYDADNDAYAYKANSAWETWLKTQTDYVTFDASGYVTWVKGADAADFAALAREFAKTLSTPDKEAVATETTVKFEGLKLGYYLVDTTLGALCTLDTTNPSAEVKDKNEKPVPEKEVKEDSTGEYGDENDAQIGDTVEFKTTIHAKKGAENYVLHDVMSDGLTLNADSITVKVGDTTLTAGTHYTLVTAPDDGCTFEIKFAQTYLDTLTGNTDIVVTYTAVLNDEAAIYTDANTNKTKLTYGDAQETEWDETKTYTYQFDLVKTDKENKLLDGAEFALYTQATGGTAIALVKESDTVYRVATDAEKSNTDGSVVTTTTITVKDGKVTIKGLDADTYYLEETKAPDGYNMLDERVEVTIEDNNLTATIDSAHWTQGGVHVVNQTGTELPSTGGIGTTLFYVLGGLLVVGAAVLLITRRRMRTEN